MVLGDLLSTYLNFIRNVLLDILLGIRYFQLGIVTNGMIELYFFKLAQSIWLGCWNKEGIQNLSVVCKIRSCLIVSSSRQDRPISSYGDLPLFSHNCRKKKDLFSSVYHHKPFINQAWQVKMPRYWSRSFFANFLLTTTGSDLWKRKKSSLNNI